VRTAVKATRHVRVNNVFVKFSALSFKLYKDKRSPDLILFISSKVRGLPVILLSYIKKFIKKDFSPKTSTIQSSSKNLTKTVGNNKRVFTKSKSSILTTDNYL
jgi:hypothetical protein